MARAIIPLQSAWQIRSYLENDLNVMHGRNDRGMKYGVRHMKELLLTTSLGLAMEREHLYREGHAVI